MYAEESDIGKSAFRLAEKKYQLHLENIVKYKNGKARGGKLVERPTDLTDVVDVDKLIEANSTSILLDHPHLLPHLPNHPHSRVYTFPAHPGLYFIRKALSPKFQRQLCREALTHFPSPPAHTNFNRSLQRSLPPNLWNAAQKGLKLAENESKKNDLVVDSQQWVETGDGPSASHLLRKLRWASIGLIYDWTRRIYVSEWGFTPLPDHLAMLASQLVSLAEHHSSSINTENNNDNTCSTTTTTTTRRKSRTSSTFAPDAALINFYRDGDTLCGHQDDAEPDLTQPLVSISLGRPGIFLIGGTSREIEPTPLLLRSGDVVVLYGESRRCFHGVPRIFPLRRKKEDGKDMNFVKKVEGEKEEGVDEVQIHPEEEEVDWGACEEEGLSGGDEDDDDDEFLPFAEYMERCRINISIRSVGSPAQQQ